MSGDVLRCLDRIFLRCKSVLSHGITAIDSWRTETNSLLNNVCNFSCWRSWGVFWCHLLLYGLELSCGCWLVDLVFTFCQLLSAEGNSVLDTALILNNCRRLKEGSIKWPFLFRWKYLPPIVGERICLWDVCSENITLTTNAGTVLWFTFNRLTKYGFSTVLVTSRWTRLSQSSLFSGVPGAFVSTFPPLSSHLHCSGLPIMESCRLVTFQSWIELSLICRAVCSRNIRVL